jgi:hypothetical protein
VCWIQEELLLSFAIIFYSPVFLVVWILQWI